MRAGARAMAAHLKRVFTTKGAKSLSAELENVGDELDSGVAPSDKWREGFERGMAVIKERAKREIRTFSPAEIERVLALPIDALDEVKQEVTVKK